MKNPSEATGDGRKNLSCQGDRQKALSGLRHQSWRAAVLLFTPWLLTIFFCRSTFGDQPAALLALIPGLAVAVRLQGYLHRHLGANHRRFEEDGLFPTLGAATWITLLRAAALVALAGFLPMAIQPGQELPNTLTWAPGTIYLGIALADLLDGFVARQQGRETELGKGLDIETDAAGLLAASLLAVALGRLPAIYLLVGLAYYPFILGIRMRQRRALPVIALQSRPSARILAGFQMGLVGLALLPLFNPAFLFLAAAIFMTPLLIGFLRDWLVVSCRITTDGHQQALLDRWAGRFCSTPLPLALRLVILAGGGMAFAGSGLYPSSPLWQGALTVCCLLTGLGFLGRSACLFLTLLLACNLSPFGPSLPALVLFGTAATLMLTGTGALSLWAPEEMILYRRHRPGLKEIP